MKTKLSSILLIFLSLTACVKETLNECPVGNARINLYAEKFQTNSLGVTDDCEEAFNKRIQFLHYILYKDQTYVMDTTISDLTKVNGSFCTFQIPDLEFGNYQLVAIGNCSPEAMRGEIHIPGNLSLLYRSVDEVEDIFAGVLEFTVDCDCTQEFAAKLRRLTGVIRCRITNVPDNVCDAEVTIHGVNSECGKDGIYSKSIDITRRVPIEQLTRSNSKDIEITMGAFPTLTDRPASYELKLYSPDKPEPVFGRVISNKVNVVRNQLVELLTDFSNGTPNFEIIVNGKWDDYINGGEVEVH